MNARVVSSIKSVVETSKSHEKHTHTHTHTHINMPTIIQGRRQS
jgi:hypothetical protein